MNKLFLKINNYYFVWMSGKCFQYVWTIRCLTRKYLFGGVINVLIDVVPFRKRKFKIMNNFKHNLNFQCWKNVPGPMWMVINFACSKILMWFKINWWRRRWKDIWNVENTFCNYVMYEMIVIIGMKYESTLSGPCRRPKWICCYFTNLKFLMKYESDVHKCLSRI